MIFWNVSIVIVSILALINFLEYYDIQSIEGYPTESFSQVEILEKTLEIRVFQNNPKSCTVAMATYMRAEL